jgi:hypothetical protein
MKLTKLHKEAIVRAVMQDIPAIDKVKRGEDICAAIVKAMSPEVRKLYKTKPEALRRMSVPYTNQYSNWHEVVVGDVTKEQIEVITAPYKKQEQERSDMHRKLTGAFEGINTLKQALTAFPEFKKYYPSEAEPTKNLPALANVAADLSKLGWPKK